MQNYTIEGHRLVFMDNYAKLQVNDPEGNEVATYNLTTAGKAVKVEVAEGNYLVGMVDRPGTATLSIYQPSENSFGITNSTMGGGVIIDLRDIEAAPGNSSSFSLDLTIDLAQTAVKVWNIQNGLRPFKLLFDTTHSNFPW